MSETTADLSFAPAGAYLEEDHDAPSPFAVWAPVDDAGTLDLLGSGDTAEAAIDDARRTVDSWSMSDATEEPVKCACGRATGVPCEWSGPESETVLVEWMPEQHRSSHAAAGNSGRYPHNGAIRFRAERGCAESLREHDGDWMTVEPG